MSSLLVEHRFPALAEVPSALAWLRMRADFGAAPRTLDAYARGLSEYLLFCAKRDIDSIVAGREQIAAFVRELSDRPLTRTDADPSSSAPALSLANATIQQRLTAVRLFYDHVV